MRILPSLLLCLLAAACAAGEPEPRQTPDIPEDAVPVGNGVYMKPLGEDDDGCMMYQAHAPGKMTTQVIQYRKKDGSFTPRKSQTDCATY